MAQRNQFIESQAFAEGSFKTFTMPRNALQSCIQLLYSFAWTGTLTGNVNPLAVERLAGYITINAKRKDSGAAVESNKIPVMMLLWLDLIRNGVYTSRTDLTSSAGSAFTLCKLWFEDIRLLADERFATLHDAGALTGYTLRTDFGNLVAASNDENNAFVGTVADKVVTGTVTVSQDEIDSKDMGNFPSFTPNFAYYSDSKTINKYEFNLTGKEFQDLIIIQAFTQATAGAVEVPANTVLNGDQGGVTLKIGSRTIREMDAATIQAQNLKYFKGLSATPVGLYVIDLCPSGSMKNQPEYYASANDDLKLGLKCATAASLGVNNTGIRVLHVTKQMTPPQLGHVAK